MPLRIEGFVIGEQMYFSPNFDEFLKGASFQRICRLFERGEEPAPDAKAVSASEWLKNGPSLPELSFAIAISVAESASLATVTNFAQELEHRLEAIMYQDGAIPTPKAFGDFLTSRTKRLQSIGALSYSETHGRLGVKYDCVRFEDPQRASELIGYIWDEYDAIRAPLVDWLSYLTYTANADARSRIGLKIGALARGRFASVLNSLLERWMLDDHPATRDIADIALAVTVFDTDPTTKKAVEGIVRDLAESSETTHLRAAVEFACGYTGSLIEGLSIDTLKRVARSKHADFKVLDVMKDSIEFLLKSSSDTDDNSLFDLEKLVTELSAWARAPERETPQRLPMFLFLSLMSSLPLRAPKTVDGLLSLHALMMRTKSREATAAVFEVALRDTGEEAFRPREFAQKILKDWQGDRLEEQLELQKEDNDPLLVLACSIYEICPTDRDRDRLAFALRRIYIREQLVNPPQNFTSTKKIQRRHDSIL